MATFKDISCCGVDNAEPTKIPALPPAPKAESSAPQIKSAAAVQRPADFEKIEKNCEAYAGATAKALDQQWQLQISEITRAIEGLESHITRSVNTLKGAQKDHAVKQEEMIKKLEHEVKKAQNTIGKGHGLGNIAVDLSDVMGNTKKKKKQPREDSDSESSSDDDGSPRSKKKKKKNKKHGGGSIRASLASVGDRVRASISGAGKNGQAQTGAAAQLANLGAKMKKAGGADAVLQTSADAASHEYDVERTKKRFVEVVADNTYFRILCAFLVLSNTMFVGYQVQWAATNLDKARPPLWLQIIDMFYTTWFTIELSIRLGAERKAFFFGAEVKWNVFDSILVTLAIQDTLAGIIVSKGDIANSSKSEKDQAGDLMYLRVVRVLRVLRVLRLFKYCPQLTIMVSGIMEGLYAMIWLFLLLGLVLFVVALVFMNAATQYLKSDETSDDDLTRVSLARWFGSVPRACLVLFKSISGGVEWEKVSDVTMAMSNVYGLIFVLYLGFVIFGVANVITSVFVRNATESAEQVKKDQTVQYKSEMRDIFHELDGTQSGYVTRLSFKTHLDEDEKLQSFLQAVDMTESDALHLFDLLAGDGETKVRVSFLAMGFLRLLGGARGTDLLFLLFESRRQNAELQSFMCFVEAYFRSLSTVLGIAVGDQIYGLT